MTTVYKKISKKSKQGEITKLMKNHRNLKHDLAWKSNRRRNIKLENWNIGLYSPNINQQNINNIPKRVVLSKRKIMRNGNVRNEFYQHRLTPKDKQIVAKKLKQKKESKKIYKERKIEIKKQILKNIRFKDLGGDTHSLLEYYKDYKKIPNKITNSKIKKIIIELFKYNDVPNSNSNSNSKEASNIIEPTNINFSAPYEEFNIDFKSEKEHARNLYNLRTNQIEITFFIDLII